MNYLVDFHCDLLSTPYEILFEKGASFREGVRCSPDQLRKGGVALQICAVYTETEKGSLEKAVFQHELFRNLPEKTDFQLCIFDGSQPLSANRTLIKEAIENASGLLEEDEPLHLLESRLEYFSNNGGLAYVGPVWNFANRFGGGALSPKGLTADGRYLLDLLERFQIPVDLSHASDLLADDILDYVDSKATRVIPIASHSNFRRITDKPRNLLVRHAKAISEKGGIIGLNFVKRFFGKDFKTSLCDHIDFAYKIGVIDCLCLGSDFFFSLPKEDKFFSSFGDSSDLCRLKEILKETYPEFCRKILFATAQDFILRSIN